MAFSVRFGRVLRGRSAFMNGQDDLSNVGLSFYAPFNDLGAGAVNLNLSRGSGSPTFTRASTATTILSNGLIGSVASGTARSCYSPAGVYLGYLAEEARTNLCLQSAVNSTAPWAENSTTTTLAALTSPDGVASGAGFISNTAAGVAQFHYHKQALSLTTSTTYTLSMWVKYKAGSGWIWLLGETSANAFCYFDVKNGVVGTATGFVSASMTAYPNGWYRCVATFAKTTATASEEIGIGLTTADNTAQWDSTGLANAQQVYVWGAQLEQAAFATSYIPTTTATVTRSQDVLQYQTSGNTSQVAGTMYVEYSIPSGITNAGNPRVIGNTGVDVSSPFSMQTNTGRPVVYDGVNSATVAAGTAIDGNIHKAGTRWGPSNVAAILDGGTIASTGAYSGNMLTQAGFYVGLGQGAGAMNGTIKNLRFWSRTLSDLEMIQFTR
jgi:hypothetical protein